MVWQMVVRAGTPPGTPGFHSVRRSTGMMLVSTWAELGRGEQETRTARITALRTDTPRSSSFTLDRVQQAYQASIAQRPGTPAAGRASILWQTVGMGLS